MGIFNKDKKTLPIQGFDVAINSSVTAISMRNRSEARLKRLTSKMAREKAKSTKVKDLKGIRDAITRYKAQLNYAASLLEAE